MKILHIYQKYLHDSQGGLEQAIFQICSATKHLGAQNRILTLGNHSGRTEILRDEARVHSYGRSLEVASCGFSWTMLKNFHKEVQWADLVHYHYPWPFADFLHILCQVQRPVVLTYHSDIVRQKILGLLYSPLMFKFLSSVNRIVATSDNYLRSSKVLAGYTNKTSVISLGLKPDTYTEATLENIYAWERKLGRNFFLFIGVLRYYKGLYTLLEAVRNAPFKTVIVGDGPLKTDLINRAGDRGLQNVCFTGFLSDEDKIALLKLCRAVVFPSSLRSEAFGMTLLEGLMLGKPLISCRLGTGTDYVNLHNETGLVVEPGNPSALRSAMDHLHDNTQDVERFSNNARKRFKNYFSSEIMGRKYVQLYSELMNQV